MIQKVMDNIFNTILLFLLIRGCFIVSAGAYKAIKIILIQPNIYFKYSGKTIYLDINGRKINNIVDETQHIQLFFACNPNPVVLKILKKINIINVSLNIPKRYAKEKINIAFVIVK